MVRVLYVITAIILLYFMTTHTTHEQFLEGTWLAQDDDFCEKTGITSMMLYVGKPTGWFYTTRQCYLVICDDVANEQIQITYYPSRAFGSACTVNITHTCSLWPENCTMEVDYLKGRLVIRNDGTVIAKLYKRHDL